MPTTTTGLTVAHVLHVRWHDFFRSDAHQRLCQTDSKVRLHLPSNGASEVLQDSYRLVAPRDGTGEIFIVPRAKTSDGSYVSDYAPLAESAIRRPKWRRADASYGTCQFCALKRPPVPLVLLILRKVTHLMSYVAQSSATQGKPDVTTDGTWCKVIQSMRLLPDLTSSSRTV